MASSSFQVSYHADELFDGSIGSRSQRLSVVQLAKRTPEQAIEGHMKNIFA